MTKSQKKQVWDALKQHYSKQLYEIHRMLTVGDARASDHRAVFAGLDALVTCLSETRLEPDLKDMLWSTVNLFQRAGARVERNLDDNE